MWTHPSFSRSATTPQMVRLPSPPHRTSLPPASARLSKHLLTPLIAPPAQCEAFPATLTISDVHYINIHGSSSGLDNATVVSLECSNPCKDITAKKTNLTNPTGKPNVYDCANLVDESTVSGLLSGWCGTCACEI